MNKLHIPSKTMIILSLMLSFLAIGGIIIWLYLVEGLVYNATKYGLYIDLYIYFIMALFAALFLIWFIGLTLAHCLIASQVFQINTTGITIGLLNKRYLCWDDISEVGQAPCVCGNLRKKYFGKNEPYSVMYILFKGSSKSFSEFGVFPLNLMRYCRYYDPLSRFLVKSWISKWMKKDYILCESEIPQEILWFELDHELYSQICSFISCEIPNKVIIE